MKTYVCETCGAIARGVGVDCERCYERTLATLILSVPQAQAGTDPDVPAAYAWARQVLARK